jgi:uncharacterized membrane protein YgcG
MPKPIFVMADDGGEESLRSMGLKADYIRVQTFRETLDALTTIGRILKSDPGRWRSLIIDSLSNVEDVIKLDLVEQKGDMVLKSNEEALSLTGWGAVGMRMLTIRTRAVQIARKHNLHCVFTALPGETTVAGIKTAAPDLGGKQGARTPGHAMVVFEMFAEKRGKEVKRFFRTSFGAGIAKDRFNCLKSVEPADFPAILAKCGFVDGRAVGGGLTVDGAGHGGGSEGGGGSGGDANDVSGSGPAPEEGAQDRKE